MFLFIFVFEIILDIVAMLSIENYICYVIRRKLMEMYM